MLKKLLSDGRDEGVKKRFALLERTLHFYVVTESNPQIRPNTNYLHLTGITPISLEPIFCTPVKLPNKLSWSGRLLTLHLHQTRAIT